MTKTITLFGSSVPRQGEPDYERAEELGRLLARAGFAVCNGGYGGTMEASARGALEAGGLTVGITVQSFPVSANRFIREEVRTESLWDRLRTLIERGDAYVILKGGTGTLLELAAVWELMNKGLMKQKPILVLGPFWEGVVDTLKEELIDEGRGDSTRFIRRAEDPATCVRLLKDFFAAVP